MTRTEPHLRWASERHLRVAFEDGSPHTRNDRVIHAMRAVRSAGIPGVLDLTPAYSTLLVHCEPIAHSPSIIEAAVRLAINTAELILATHTAAPIEISVCYCARCGPDLPDAAACNSIDSAEVVQLHTLAAYTVAFLGFSPGFPYLLGLPETLATPRLDSPRPRVPAGSVGIAGTQTGIYPRATPGGWRLIGRTSATLFDPAAPSPTLLRAGNHVRFVRVDHDSLGLPPGSEIIEGGGPS